MHEGASAAPGGIEAKSASFKPLTPRSENSKAQHLVRGDHVGIVLHSLDALSFSHLSKQLSKTPT